MTISDLPAINASLNAVSTVFICAGWFWIRRNLWQRHVPCMIVALIASTGFLVGYIVYHLHAGEKSSGYTGLIAWIYFPMLITHILLAYLTVGDRDSRAGVSTPLGSTSPDRPLDDADLALCFGHRRARLFHALPLVPAAES